jgi:5-methylcytosine-specific restriction endonuclease McrA
VSNSTTIRLCSRCRMAPRAGNSYCKPCFNAYRRERRAAKATPIPCGQCGVMFIKWHNTARYCGAACADLQARKISGRPTEPFPDAVCANVACGATFTPKRHDSVTCSVPCWRETYRPKFREAWIRRRSMMSGWDPIPVEAIEAKIAYWGGKCWMCGEPYEHIDHVKPVSKNGPHLLANLRPACASCNVHKHARWYGVSGLDRFLIRA